MWQENVPPQDIEAEQAVLGAIFLDAEALVEAMAQIEPARFLSTRPSDCFSFDDCLK